MSFLPSTQKYLFPIKYEKDNFLKEIAYPSKFIKMELFLKFKYIESKFKGKYSFVKKIKGNNF
jgi:hypothetical protein